MSQAPSLATWVDPHGLHPVPFPTALHYIKGHRQVVALATSLFIPPAAVYRSSLIMNSLILRLIILIHLLPQMLMTFVIAWQWGFGNPAIQCVPVEMGVVQGSLPTDGSAPYHLLFVPTSLWTPPNHAVAWWLDY